MVIKCFEPIIDNNSEILILGSIPSRISRENGFYYSNKTNRFWKLLSAIYGVDFLNLDNNSKSKMLLKCRIAMSDVYRNCEMKVSGSSLDSNIKGYKFNDIISLIKGTNIKRIFITSKKAYQDFTNEFGTYFVRHNIPVINLPSPSSANRSVFRTDEELLEVWKNLFSI